MNLQLFQVDAFTKRVFGGNPAAVCPLDAWLPDAQLQAIATENNLSETAFLVPKGTEYELRWFTPALEVDLCGHATLASAHVLYQHLGYTAPSITFLSRSGPLLVSQSEKGYSMDFPAIIPQEVAPPPQLARALGAAPQAVFRANDYLLTIFESEAQIRALAPDFGLLRQVDALGTIVSAPGKEVDFVSRFFAPRAGIDEDPVTGSAHCSLIPYWAGVLGKTDLHALQISARQGELFCRLQGERVAIAGQAVTYMLGEILV
ncbi:MAG: PhzF family phenazine biosynthesis protein [Bacteroidetes bacterium]|nr:MAG: PhzF family phenazine biosynthesis protein [Bacteroidota bacterium]